MAQWLIDLHLVGDDDDDGNSFKMIRYERI